MIQAGKHFFCEVILPLQAVATRFGKRGNFIFINRDLSDNLQVTDQLFRVSGIQRIIIVKPNNINQVIARITFKVSCSIFKSNIGRVGKQKIVKLVSIPEVINCKPIERFVFFNTAMYCSPPEPVAGVFVPGPEKQSVQGFHQVL